MPLWRPGFLERARRATGRLPPGQREVRGWPVLHEGNPPTVDLDAWRLRVWGEVEQPISLDWEALHALSPFETSQDFHCVTSWSRYDNAWKGFQVREVLSQARPRPQARYALVHAADDVGYTANLTLDDMLRSETLLATHHDGQALEPEHGGPIRLVVHHRYAWKSVKWVVGIELLSSDQRGYWEQRGYHKRADPWLDQRYSRQE